MLVLDDMHKRESEKIKSYKQIGIETDENVEENAVYFVVVVKVRDVPKWRSAIKSLVSWRTHPISKAEDELRKNMRVEGGYIYFKDDVSVEEVSSEMRQLVLSAINGRSDETVFDVDEWECIQSSPEWKKVAMDIAREYAAFDVDDASKQYVI